jgi:hypothetical protein
MRIRVSEAKEITNPREQLFAAQAEYRRAQAAVRRVHEILKDAPSWTARTRSNWSWSSSTGVAEMLNKFGDLPCLAQFG